MIVFVWDMKRKGHFPHLLPLKEGGEESDFLFIPHIKPVMKYHNQLTISSWRSWWLLFVSFVMPEGAAQRSVCTLFFFFTCFYFCVGGRKQIQIIRWRLWCKINKWTDVCTRNRYINWTIPHVFWFNWQWEKRKWGIIPSPPSFKGRRWGRCTFLFTLHTNTIMKQPNQLRISSRR